MVDRVSAISPSRHCDIADHPIAGSFLLYEVREIGNPRGDGPPNAIRGRSAVAFVRLVWYIRRINSAWRAAMAGQRAVFLDRDGVIIDDVHYLARLDQVRLIPGAATAIRRLNQANIPVVVVTNQSGVARGLFAEAF